MISPTDADGSFIAHNAVKGLPDQAEIIPDASKICLSTDREARGRGERVLRRQAEEKHSAWPPSVTDSAKKGSHKHPKKKEGAKRRIRQTRDVTHLGIEDSYIPYTAKYAPETGSHF